ncbi:GDP-mannose 4,6-dehydratase [Bradyrhizobium symbiodeficiens]|uniref:GDP-mannose 4,6-dehydratase n=1 Tax=Bradyrhizobium symbiodeficiens TaxID=1404367 RepID=UPI0039C86B7D
MIRKKAHLDLDAWLERACTGLVASLRQQCHLRQDRHRPHAKLEDALYLGNLEDNRDWGHAKDYFEGMHRSRPISQTITCSPLANCTQREK